MSKQKHTEAELKLARMAMNSFFQMPCNDVVKFLESYLVSNPSPAERVLNSILEQLITDFKKQYLLS